MARNTKFSIRKPFLKQIQKPIGQIEQSSFATGGGKKKKRERWKSHSLKILPAVQKTR